MKKLKNQKSKDKSCKIKEIITTKVQMEMIKRMIIIERRKTNIYNNNLSIIFLIKIYKWLMKILLKITQIIIK